MTRIRPTVLLGIFLALFTLFAPVASAQDAYSGPSPMDEARLEIPAIPDGWDTVKAPFTRFHGHPSDYNTLLHLSRYTAESLPRLASELKVPIGDTIHVYVVPSDAQFQSMQPGNAPSWADGVAYPALGVIYLHAPRARNAMGTPLEKVLDHELIHIILGRAFFPHPTPQWLQEGVAKVKAKEYGPETTRQLGELMATGGLLSLGSLDRGFPSDPVKAQLAYAQSADFIAWMQVEYGMDSVGDLVLALAAGDDIDAAIFQATGDYLDDVEQAWRSELTSGIPLSITAFANESIFWGFGGVLLLIGGVMRRRRFHKRLAEMEAEEALVDELMAKIRADEAEARVRQEWENMTGRASG